MSPTRKIVYRTGLLIKDHHIGVEVEELVEPIQKGASLRTHRLWIDDKPANFMWSFESAVREAEFAVQHSVQTQLAYQTQRVQKLEIENARLRNALKDAIEQGQALDQWFTHYPPIKEVYHRKGDYEACALCDSEVPSHTTECPTAQITQMIIDMEEALNERV